MFLLNGFFRIKILENIEEIPYFSKILNQSIGLFIATSKQQKKQKSLLNLYFV